MKDPASGVASTSVAVRNHPTDPYRTLPSTFANGTLRATLDTGVASRVDIRVRVADNAGNVSEGNPTRLSATSAKVGRRLHRVRGGRVRIPFGRKAKLRGRLSLSTGGSLGRPDGRRDLDGAEEGLQDRGGRERDHRSARPLLDQRPGGAEPGLPPRVRRRPRGARDRARALGPRAGVEHDQGVTHAAVRRPRPLLRPPARSRRARARAVSCVVLQGREGGKWRTFSDARTHKKGRWHVSYRFSGRPGSYPIRAADPPPGRLPVRARLLAQAHDPGGLGGRILRARGLVAPDGSRAQRDRASPCCCSCCSPRRSARQRTTSTRARCRNGHAGVHGGLDALELTASGARASRTPCSSRPSSRRLSALRGEISKRVAHGGATSAGSSRRRRTRRSATTRCGARSTAVHRRDASQDFWAQRRSEVRSTTTGSPLRSVRRRGLPRCTSQWRRPAASPSTAREPAIGFRPPSARSSACTRRGVRFAAAACPSTATPGGSRSTRRASGSPTSTRRAFTQPPSRLRCSTTAAPLEGERTHVVRGARRRRRHRAGRDRRRRPLGRCSQRARSSSADAVVDRSSPSCRARTAATATLVVRHRADSRTARTPSRRPSPTPPGTRLARTP